MRARSLVLAAIFAVACQAEAARLVFTDQTPGEGDRPSSAGDLTRVVLDIDLETGDYNFTAFSAPSTPFQGSTVRLILNLGNERLNERAPLIRNDFPLTTPSGVLAGSGSVAAFTRWQVGDVIVTEAFSPDFGLPLNNGFTSGIFDLNRDGPHPGGTIDNLETSAVLVPEAGAGSLAVVACVSGVAARRRRGG